MSINGTYLTIKPSLDLLKSPCNDGVDTEKELNRDEVEQLKRLFDTRYQAKSWPRAFANAELDCEGLAHYLLTGKIGQFEQTKTSRISQVELEKGHKPYTCYKIWQPNAPWAREELGFWGPVHYFMHLENSKYISKNGCGPIRIFSSFKEMLKEDAFPFGFTTEDYKEASDIQQAAIGQSLIGTMQEH